MQMKKGNWAPISLTATLTTNLLNPGTTTGGVGMPTGSANLYFQISKLRFVNKTNASHNVTIYKGATVANVAGTEILLQKVVPANDTIEYNGQFRMDVADFLVGGADAVTSVVMLVEGEIGVAG